MNQPSLKPVVQRLADWRAELIERFRTGDQTVLPLKLSLDLAIAWLETGEQCQLAPAEVVVLPKPDDAAPLGEFRVVWDAESEERGHWQEIARAYPGDLLIKLE